MHRGSRLLDAARPDRATGRSERAQRRRRQHEPAASPSDVESAPIKDDAAGRYQALREATLKGEPAILFGTDGGLFVSTDGARSFSSQKNDGNLVLSDFRAHGEPEAPDDVMP